MAKRRRIPTYHMEAGNRCFDANVPEETNRRLVDHTADFNLAYTEHARRNLLAEGLHPRRIIVTGSPMAEVLDAAPRRHRGLRRPGRPWASTTGGTSWSRRTGRRTSTPPPGSARLLDCLNVVAAEWELPVLGLHPPAHPQASRGPRPGLATHPLVRFHEPFGFLDYNRLQLSASCVLSDSGTIAEESTILGFPAVTLRSSIERPEALDTGAITMTDLDPDAVLRGHPVRHARGRRRAPRSTTRSPTPRSAWSTSSCPPPSSTSSGRGLR